MTILAKVLHFGYKEMMDMELSTMNRFLEEIKEMELLEHE